MNNDSKDSNNESEIEMEKHARKKRRIHSDKAEQDDEEKKKKTEMELTTFQSLLHRLRQFSGLVLTVFSFIEKEELVRIMYQLTYAKTPLGRELMDQKTVSKILEKASLTILGAQEKDPYIPQLPNLLQQKTTSAGVLRSIVLNACQSKSKRREIVLQLARRAILLTKYNIPLLESKHAVGFYLGCRNDHSIGVMINVAASYLMKAVGVDLEDLMKRGRVERGHTCWEEERFQELSAEIRRKYPTHSRAIEAIVVFLTAIYTPQMQSPRNYYRMRLFPFLYLDWMATFQDVIDLAKCYLEMDSDHDCFVGETVARMISSNATYFQRLVFHDPSTQELGSDQHHLQQAETTEEYEVGGGGSSSNTRVSQHFLPFNGFLHLSRHTARFPMHNGGGGDETSDREDGDDDDDYENEDGDDFKTENTGPDSTTNRRFQVVNKSSQSSTETDIQAVQLPAELFHEKLQQVILSMIEGIPGLRTAETLRKCLVRRLYDAAHRLFTLMEADGRFTDHTVVQAVGDAIFSPINDLCYNANLLRRRWDYFPPHANIRALFTRNKVDFCEKILQDAKRLVFNRALGKQTQNLCRCGRPVSPLQDLIPQDLLEHGSLRADMNPCLSMLCRFYQDGRDGFWCLCSVQDKSKSHPLLRPSVNGFANVIRSANHSLYDLIAPYFPYSSLLAEEKQQTTKLLMEAIKVGNAHALEDMLQRLGYPLLIDDEGLMDQICGYLEKIAYNESIVRSITRAVPGITGKWPFTRRHNALHAFGSVSVLIDLMAFHPQKYTPDLKKALLSHPRPLFRMRFEKIIHSRIE